jgi:hypothetical protein
VNAARLCRVGGAAGTGLAASRLRAKAQEPVHDTEKIRARRRLFRWRIQIILNIYKNKRCILSIKLKFILRFREFCLNLFFTG